MNLFRSSGTAPVAQIFQAEFAREVLLSQKLRASVLVGLFGVGLLFLLIAHVVFETILEEAFFPGPVMPFCVVMMVFQLGLRFGISGVMKQEKTISNWVWYVSAGFEVTLVTLMFLILRFNYASPTYVLSAPAILVYALFITLATLRLDGRFALFVGGLASMQYLAISILIYGSVAGLSTFNPTYETLFFSFMRAGILLMCGVGAAFVARELRLRMYHTYGVIEERNRVEAANQAKSTFLANVSHEIRTPLNAIMGYAQLMAADRSLSAEQQLSIQNISTSGGHLTDLINRVLDLSKIEAGREEVQVADFDLVEMVRELEALFKLRCEQKGLAWDVDLEVTSAQVRGDVGKLRQVLINLVGNAVKFTSYGQVVLKVMAKSDDQFYFEVLDTGPGIPLEQQTTIFDPFQRAALAQQTEGSGLGLAIAYGYVEMMGGQLEVVSEVGEGSRFTFVLQLSPALREMRRVSDRVDHLSPGFEVQALVVDDVVQNRDVLAQILRRVGVTVVDVASGAEALESVADQLPDIVFMDILMPEMSGEETMRLLREKYGRDPFKVVAVSASVLEHQRKAYLEAGFDGFLDKPVHMNQAYALLADMLDVQFVDAEDVVEKEVVDLSAVVLPEPVFSGLEQAAAGFNVTQFNEYLDEAEALGEAETQLVAPLRQLSLRYDMKAALEALKEIHHE